jgi:Carboxypeptidase regulatory-like domain
MSKIVHVLFVCLFISNFCQAQTNTEKVGQPEPPAKEVRSTSEAAASLPVRRVVLYKNGVGYFEHLGRVRGAQNVHVDFTSAQLNDVLKSLTALDLSGGRITGVDYNSEAPLARRLSTLRLALGEKPSMADFLAALRGARVEVHGASGPALAGKLLSVERKTRTGSNWTVGTDEISLITDTGEVRSIDLNPTTSVRIAEHDLRTEVGKYLGLIASARDQDVRRMTLSTTGTGERNLFVSYISEVPIWKTTYRIVLPTKTEKRPLLQGWAIVDNTVGEDWNDVELSLVAGAPHSFIQQLSEPIYGRRPIVALPEAIQLSPQTHAATLVGGNGSLSGTVSDQSGAIVGDATVRLVGPDGAVIAQTTTDSNGQYSLSSLPTGTYRVEMERIGFRKNIVSSVNLSPGANQINGQLQVGTATETVMVTAAPSDLNTTASEVSSSAGKLAVANRAHVGVGAGSGGLVESIGIASKTDRNIMSLAILNPGAVENSIGGMEAAASGQGLGDLFEYKLKDRVTLKKNQSALVPIVQTELDAERVSLWSGTTGSGRPLRGLWLKNTSALTLDGGSFSVLDNEVFAGEGLTDPIKPGERRLVSYATDLGLLVQAETNERPQHVTRVKISKGVLTQVSELQQRTLYTVRNEEDAARRLIIEHPARYSWTLVKGSEEPEEKAPNVYRFRLEVRAKASATLPVEEAHAQETTYQLSDLNDDQIALFVRQKTISMDMQQALSRITAQKAIVAKLEEEMGNRQKDIERIVDDQGRLRENMKALRGSAEEKALLQRYTRQLDEQENRIDTLRKKIEETEAERDKANEMLEKMIDDLQLEATL